MNLPGSLDHVRSQTEIPIRIFNCEGLEIYDGRINPAPPGAALEQAREARLTDPKVTKAVHIGLQKQLALHRDLPEILARMTEPPMP